MYKLLVGQKLWVRVLRHLVLFLGMIFLFSWVAWSRNEDQHGFWQEFVMVTTNAIFFFGYAYITVYLLIPVLLA